MEKDSLLLDRVQLQWEGARHRTLSGLGVGFMRGGALHQGRRSKTIDTCTVNLRASSVITVGFMGISEESVEGDDKGVPVQGRTTQMG
jgi:hypothetical protein